MFSTTTEGMDVDGAWPKDCHSLEGFSPRSPNVQSVDLNLGEQRS
jgi:hypothetical protein